MDLLDHLTQLDPPTPEPITDQDRAWAAGVGRALVRHTTTGALGWARLKDLPLDEYEHFKEAP